MGINLTEDENAKFRAFVDGLQSLVDEVFGEEDNASVMLGLQFGHIGSADDEDDCLLITNLPAVFAPSAVHDMFRVAQSAADREAHKVAEAFGLDPEQTRTLVVDMSDLADLPSTTESAEG